MSKNTNLIEAKKAKNDEFYTRYEDIKKEVDNYKEQLKGLTIYCPCDDYRKSQFYQYFKDNFIDFQLKAVITTCYPNGLMATYNGEEKIYKLKGDGDFRSDECSKIRDSADIIITNPPFSLMRYFIAWIGDKKFLIIGTPNIITYKNVFTKIMNNTMRAGYVFSKKAEFDLPDGGSKNVNIAWWTTLQVNAKKPLVLTKKYDPSLYPKYDNYDAINVNKVCDIPKDYLGVMGVPITYLGCHCPNQFEILEKTTRDSSFRNKEYTINDDPKFNDRNGSPCIKINNTLKPIYARLLIKRKK